MPDKNEERSTEINVPVICVLEEIHWMCWVSIKVNFVTDVGKKKKRQGQS